MKRSLLLLFLLLLCPFASAQGLTVEGKVVDLDTQEPVIGALIIEVGTQNSTISDVYGEFKLNVQDGNNKLEVRYSSYTTQSLTPAPKMLIELAPDVLSIEEVVVIGYGTMRKSDLTGAVAKVSEKDMSKVSTVDATQMIQGKVAGVTIQSNSGEPGSGTKVRVRGVGSINNSEPLYVVDGFPMGGISHIAPSDIESMEVLKDASATAIYGSRGSNGVIMVTTKSGRYDAEPVVSFNSYGSMSSVSKQIEMLNATQYATIKSESLANAGVTMSDEWASILGFVTDNNLVGTNWQDEIFRTAYSQNYNTSITGGSQKNKYNIGITYSDEQGVLKETSLDKIMVNASNQYRFTDNIDFGLDVYYTQYERGSNNSDFYTGPLVAALRADPVSAAWDPYTGDFGEMYFAYGTNPARAVDENKYTKTNSNQIVANSFLNIKDIFIEGLSFRAQFGAKVTSTLFRDYDPEFYVAPDQQRAQSKLYEQRSDAMEWTTSEYFNYNNTFGKHTVSGTVGFEASKYENSYLNATAYDVPEQTSLQYISASTNSTQVLANGLKSHSSLVSFFARGNYNFDNRYLFTFTVRADGSSKFIDHWGYFPSFSAGWNINQESFMDGASDVVSQLKLRAGWGQVGNQSAAGNHDYVALMTNGYTYLFGETVVDGAIQQQIANSELSWETSEQLNIGLDFGLFGGSLSGTFDYFIRDTKDMILSTPIPMYAGFWRPNTNAGSIRNSGVELSMNYNKSFEDFSFNVGFNISHIKNEVTSIGGGDPIEGGIIQRIGNTTRTEVGHEIAYYYGLQTDGIFNSQEEVDAYINENGELIQPNAAPGDVKFIDVDGDGKIDETTDRVKLGSAIPDFSYALNGSMAYKGFDLNFSLQGVHGAEIVNGMYSVLQSTDMSEWNVGAIMLDRWTPENSDSNIPRVHASDPNKNTKFSDRYVEDGSFLRLRNIQIGYTLPEGFLGTKSLRFYLSADNLFTISNYSGFDPEIAGGNLNSGVDVANYPIPRTISLGINLQF